jgi:TolB protein
MTRPPVRYEGLTPQVAPDGRRVAVARGEYGGENIWIVGATGDNATRLSFGSDAGASLPVWSSNGRRVMYKAGQRLIIKGVDDGAEEIVRDPLRGVLQDWSRDGRFVVVQRVDGHASLAKGR